MDVRCQPVHNRPHFEQLCNALPKPLGQALLRSGIHLKLPDDPWEVCERPCAYALVHDAEGAALLRQGAPYGLHGVDVVGTAGVLAGPDRFLHTVFGPRLARWARGRARCIRGQSRGQQRLTAAVKRSASSSSSPPPRA